MNIENSKIGIIGLGYVGLPLAVAFAEKYPVIGFDINQNRVNELLEGVDNTLEIDSSHLQSVLRTALTDGNGFFPTTNSAGALLGFSAGTYPTAPYTSNKNASSNILPVGSTVNAILVHCNLVSNNITMPSDVIDLIPINSTYGSNISYQPPYEKNVSLCDGTYSSMTITFTDQNNNTLMALDANIAMTLVIKKRKK